MAIAVSCVRALITNVRASLTTSALSSFAFASFDRLSAVEQPLEAELNLAEIDELFVHRSPATSQLD